MSLILFKEGLPLARFTQVDAVSLGIVESIHVGSIDLERMIVNKEHERVLLFHLDIIFKPVSDS